MASAFVRNLLTEQRKRLTGTVMAYLEANVYDHLDPAEQTELRHKMLAAISAYHDVCLDLLKASVEEGTMINEAAVEMLATIHRDIRHLTRDRIGG